MYELATIGKEGFLERNDRNESMILKGGSLLRMPVIWTFDLAREALWMVNIM